MSRQTKISVANPIHMIPVGALPSKYHRGTMDSQFLSELRLPWQGTTLYRQPFERADPFRFQCSVTANTSVTLTMMDSNGYTVLNVPIFNTAVIPGNLSDTGDQMTAYLFRLANFNAITRDGVYYFLLTVTYDANHIRSRKSEPVWIRDKHPDTVLLEYTGAENTDDLWFEQLPTIFRMRVVGMIGEDQPAAETTVYTDQLEQVDVLDFRPYNTMKFKVGGNGTGVPAWMRRKLNHIMGLSPLINGTQYKLDDGAKWELSGIGDASLLSGAAIQVREANDASAGSDVEPSLRLFNVTSYPFAIQSLLIGTTVANLQLPGSPAVISNSTVLNAWINTVNAALTDRELLGSISLDGTEVSYHNAPGEVYKVAQASVYFSSFGFDFVSPGSPGPSAPSLSFNIFMGSVVIEWGDGSITSTGALYTLTPVSHSYPLIAGTYPVKIWGQVERFSITNSRRTGLSGILPATLQVLTVSGGNFPANTFNFSMLNGLSNLASLSIVNAGLTAANGFNSYNLPRLTSINFSGNALSSSVVSAFMYDVWYNSTRNSPAITGGTFSIAGQSPTATLNANGNYYKSLLQASPLSWTVNN